MIIIGETSDGKQIVEMREDEITLFNNLTAGVHGLKAVLDRFINDAKIRNPTPLTQLLANAVAEIEEHNCEDRYNTPQTVIDEMTTASMNAGFQGIGVKKGTSI